MWNALLTALIMAGPTPLAAPVQPPEVAWGCINSPNDVVSRARRGAFAPWVVASRLPDGVVGQQRACVICKADAPGLRCAWLPAMNAPSWPRNACPAVVAAADASGAVDLGTWWQAWQKAQAPTSIAPQVAQRLGANGFSTACITTRVAAPTRWEAAATLVTKTANPGILGALGPSVPARFDDIPASVRQAWGASVVPARMWNVLETAVAGAWPLQYTVARMQLDGFEQGQGVRWAEDVLGQQPVTWRAYETRRGDWVALLAVADGSRAAKFLAGAVAEASDLWPGVRLVMGPKPMAAATLTVPGSGSGKSRQVYLAFLPHAIVVATSASALTTHLTKGDRINAGAALRVEPATVFGTGDGNVVAAAWTAGGSPSEALPLVSGARSAWFLAPSPQGWRASVEMTVYRQQVGQ